MIFIFGEKIRAKSAPAGEHTCPVCRAERAFTAQEETLWFCLFAIPLLPVEQTASYWRCEGCLNAYSVGRDRQPELGYPSHVPLVKQVITYLLVGYNQSQHAALAGEICLKITGFDIDDSEFRQIARDIEAARVDMVEQVRESAPVMNGIGKQQLLEAAFLTTYICCDMQYEDRLRVNLMGNALGVGLEFVEYAIQQTRKHNYYGVRRLVHTESA